MAVPTGGTRTNVGNVYTHVFTANGTFVTDAPLAATVLVIGGGGGAGNWGGGGGGAGGMYDGALSIPAGSHAISIGRGGNLGTGNPTDGERSDLGSLAGALGGGSAGYGGQAAGVGAGRAGASGGGGSTWNSDPGGAAQQYYPGGKAGDGPVSGSQYGGGGGGGHTGPGANSPLRHGGNGGGCYTRPSTGLTYRGGGGGGTNSSPAGTSGGGGAGAGGAGNPGNTVGGTPNTGSGAGGCGDSGTWNVGGSGIIIITYTYIPPPPTNTTPAVVGAAVEGSMVSYTPGVWAGGAVAISQRWTLDGVTLPGFFAPFKIPYGFAGGVLRCYERAQGAPGGNPSGEVSSNTVTVIAGTAPKFVALGTKPDYRSVVLADRPVLYYPMDEVSGTVTKDLSDKGRDGTIVGGMTFGQGGILPDGSKCFQFDGVNDGITIPSSFAIGAGFSITVEWWAFVPVSWVKANSLFVPGTDDSTNRINIHAPWSDKSIYWDYGDISAAKGRIALDYTPFLDAWAHVVVTYDVATGKRNIVINGVERTSRVDASVPGVNNANFVVSGGPGGFWMGNLDHFAVYFYALPVARALAHYNARNISNPPVNPKWVPLENVGAPPATPKWVPVIDLV